MRARAALTLGRLIAVAAVVGALGAGTAIAVRFVLQHGVRWVHGADDMVSALSAAPIWLRLVAPTAGGIAAGLLVHVLLRRGSPAVADVMEAVALGRGRPRLGAAAAQAAGTVAAVMGGGSLGREGPLIQLGASVGQVVADGVTLSAGERRALVAAGTAAGFAAAYNTPLAAVLFVLEVIVGAVTLDVVAPVAVATAVGTLLTRAVVGGGPIYGVRAFALASASELAAFAVVGVAAAIVGVAFMKLLAAGERGFARLGAWPRPVRTGLGGLIVGAICCGLPTVAGNGYEPLRDMLDGEMVIGALLLLAVAKAVATTASVTSGSPGGVFTPTMLIGAAIGGAIGQVVASAAPFGADVAPGGYALVGMAAAVAATTHAPLMAAVLGFELSGDYPIVLPLLLATAIATLLARWLEPDSIYTAELRRRGIPWEGTVAQRLARAARARDIMSAAPAVVAADEPIARALARLADGPARLLYVVDGGPLRALSLTEARALWAGYARGEPPPDGLTAGALATAIETVAPDESLLDVGEKLWRAEWGELPVVDPAAPGAPLGVVTRKALLGAVDRELLQREPRG